MAHPRRIARVAKQIEREVGALLIYDKVLQQAVCPERRRGIDNALSALASVTDVQVTNDLQVAKVYLSIYSDDAGKAAAITGLQRLEGYVRKHVGQKVRLRLTPEIRFIMDESIERTERVFKLLDQVRAIEAGEVPPPPITIPEDVEEEGAEAFSFLSAVDLGMFAEEEDEEEDEAVEESSSNSVSGNSGRSSKSDGKSSSAGLSNDEVDEMMALFRQESAGKGASGPARAPRRYGGGRGQAKVGGRGGKK